MFVLLDGPLVELAIQRQNGYSKFTQCNLASLSILSQKLPWNIDNNLVAKAKTFTQFSSPLISLRCHPVPPSNDPLDCRCCPPSPVFLSFSDTSMLSSLPRLRLPLISFSGDSPSSFYFQGFYLIFPYSMPHVSIPCDPSFKLLQFKLWRRQ